jgi:hypothetical protein
MLSDVVAWEGHMRDVAGTAAADPRHPDIQAKLQSWRGTIEAMSEIEIGIDPGATACDRFLAAIAGSTLNELKKILPTAPALGASGVQPVTHCETLPGIFTRMMRQVSGDTPAAPGIPFILDQQCKLSWLPDEYFASLEEARATAGALSPVRPTTASAKARKPTIQEQTEAITRCRSLFVPPSGAVHGNLVDSLVIDLDSIIYREGREAPPSR